MRRRTDFLVVKRSAAVDVWTNRDVKKHEIIFAPASTIVKNHYGTKGRSVLLQGGNALHPSHKHFVMERNPPVAEDEDYTFALRWATERTNESSEANLHLEYPTPEVASSVLLRNGRNTIAADAATAAALVPPVLTTNTPVDKQTRLVAINDLNLHNIDEDNDNHRRQDKAGASASVANKQDQLRHPWATVRHSNDRRANGGYQDQSEYPDHEPRTNRSANTRKQQHRPPTQPSPSSIDREPNPAQPQPTMPLNITIDPSTCHTSKHYVVTVDMIIFQYQRTSAPCPFLFFKATAVGCVAPTLAEAQGHCFE